MFLFFLFLYLFDQGNEVSYHKIIVDSCDFSQVEKKLSAINFNGLDSLKIEIPSNTNSWVVYSTLENIKSEPSYTLKCHLKKLPNSIIVLRELKYLKLSFLGLSTLPNRFYELRNLQYLDLSFNKKLDIGMEIYKLLQLEQLKTLNIHGCIYNKNDIKLLKNEIPELSIQTEVD